MNISKSFKFKLITSAKQSATFSKWAGSCRFLYNWGLAERKNAWEENKAHISYVDQANKLTDLKKNLDTSWLKEAPAQILQQSLRDLDQAYKNFFMRIKKGQVGKEAGFPKFKKKGRTLDSFRFPDPKQFKVRKISSRRAIITLPKIGDVKFYYSREIEGDIRNITISRDGGDWFVAFNCECLHLPPVDNNGVMIGIDRGVANTLVTSEGTFYNLPTDEIKNLEKRKSALQRRSRKKQKFSKNWITAIRKEAKLDKKITRVREDFNHKISTKLAKNHSYITMEDLQIKNMSKSASGTVENPGVNVKAKSGLNRSILRQGWYRFQMMLDYKSVWYGGYVEYVDPKYTSRKCSRCGHSEKDNRLNQEAFCCRSCGFELNADHNAAINILTRGHRGSACGDADTGRIDEARTTDHALA